MDLDKILAEGIDDIALTKAATLNMSWSSAPVTNIINTLKRYGNVKWPTNRTAVKYYDKKCKFEYSPKYICSGGEGFGRKMVQILRDYLIRKELVKIKNPEKPKGRIIPYN